MTNPFRQIRRVVLSCALIVLCFATVLRAEDAPKFSAPEVNAFVVKFNGLAEEVTKANASGDATKSAAAMQNLMTAISNDGPTVDAKLTADERPKFEKYIETRMKDVMPQS